MSTTSDSRTPFEKRPKFSWRELGFIAGLICTAATAWSIQRADIIKLQEEHAAQAKRIERLEDAMSAIPVIKSDIGWIRASLERQERRP